MRESRVMTDQLGATLQPKKWQPKEIRVRYLVLVVSIVLLFGQSAFANEAAGCFEKAWAHPNDGGLGLPRGLAVELCTGATDAVKVTSCFKKAWAHPNEGLGLPAGLAVELCTGATDAVKVTSCFEKAWAHPNKGGSA
jgi:hypothetical protein